MKLAISDTPAKVLEAANKAFPDGEIKDVEKEEKHGVVIYEVKKVVGDDEYEIKITEEGNVEKLKRDTKTVKFNLSKKLHKELRIKAIQNEMTIQQVLENLVSKWVKEG
jgi:hypothetical protein